MITNNHYLNSILLLSYLLMHADGILEDSEKEAIRKICSYENIPEEDFKRFMEKISRYTEKQIYDMGIEEVEFCSDVEKSTIFAWLHRISEADGNVHVKEVRFLLYSVKKAGIEFEDVLERSKELPSLL